MALRVRVLALLASAAFVPAAVAQELVWREFQKTTFPDCVLTFDSARSRFVAVSGDRTLEWNGSDWQTRATPHPPPQWLSSAIAYDSVRRRTLLFGGFDGDGALTDALWEYDGNDWSQRAAGGPPARYRHAMAFDPVRGRLVLFGGDNGSDLDDTWVWDGNTWTQLTPAVAPTPRVLVAMAFHAASGQTILFGGISSPPGAPRVTHDDTWAWNGTTWTALAPATIPPARCGHNMSSNYTGGPLVMFGGVDRAANQINDTWEWNGVNWASGLPGPGPSTRSEVGMATDNSGVTLLLGGDFALWHAGPPVQVEAASLGDTWLYLAGAVPWTQLKPTGPPYRTSPYLEYDNVRDRLILAGGSDGTIHHTWEWDGTNWSQIFAPVELPVLGFAASSFDRNRGVMVVFGGFAVPPFGFGITDWTYEWNGTTWSRINVLAPPGRMYHAMAFDRARGVVVMYGGQSVLGISGDTWTWNGTVWTQVSNTGPAARTMPGMAYDAGRARVVLFGGETPQGTGVQLFNDTWEWDGTTWNQASPLVSPSPRWAPVCAYEPRRGRIVLVGGTALVTPTLQFAVREAWEWDGVNWTGGPRDVPVNTTRAGFGAMAMVYHDRLQQLMLVTSVFNANAGESSDLWIGAPDAASVATGGTGCGGAVVPTLRPFGQPVAGNALFALDLLGVPAGALAFLGLSTGTGTLPLGSGCSLYLQGTAVIIAAPTNAAGFASVQVPIPTSAVFLGFDVFGQAAALDPTAPLGLDMTQFVRARVGI